MLRHFCLSSLLLISFSLTAQISTGDIAIVGYDADSDNLAFIALVDMPASTTIYFTDNEWNELAIGSGGAFNDTSEGFLTWTASSIIPAGTVIELTSINSGTDIASSSGSISRSGNINFGTNNETVYAYLGTDEETPTEFLTAFSNDLFNASSGTLTNTGLTAGVNAIAIADDEDIAIYTGSNTCDGTTAECAAMLNNPANWTTDDGSGNQSADGSGADWADVQLTFGGSALPVVWLYFKGMSEENMAILQWATASEVNCSHFEIECSVDKGYSFQQVGTIKGGGTLNESSYYEFQSTLLAPESYYRLKQVDYDGVYEYSEMIRIYQPSLSWSYYPNPVFDDLYITGLADTYQITIRGLSGKTELVYKSLSGPQRIKVEQLTPGNYLIEIFSVGITKTGVLIKK